jgi:hypothetical protein
MAKFKAYDYRQRVFLPVSLEDQLMPGTLEFAIHTLVKPGWIRLRLSRNTAMMRRGVPPTTPRFA